MRSAANPQNGHYRQVGVHAAGGGTVGADPLLPWRYGRVMLLGRGESPSGSWTGRAVSAGPGRGAADARGGASILIVGPGGWPSAARAITARAGPGFRVVISAEPADLHAHNPINTGILPACLPRQTIAELQATVNSDPGILLTVDIYRRDVRARGDLVGRFELSPFWCGDGAEGMARGLLTAQRLLGSAGLAGDVRIRMQRRLTAICDAMKVPGADVARNAWRLERLLTDLAAGGQAGPDQGPGGSAY